MNYKINKQLWLLILLRNNYRTKIQKRKNATIFCSSDWQYLQDWHVQKISTSLHLFSIENSPVLYFERSSGGAVVKLLAYGARGPDSIPGLAATISEIGYLLLQSRDKAETSLKRHKFSKQPTYQYFE